MLQGWLYQLPLKNMRKRVVSLIAFVLLIASVTGLWDNGDNVEAARSIAEASQVNEIGVAAERHEVGGRLNNRAENSHQPFRRRERVIAVCQTAQHANLAAFVIGERRSSSQVGGRLGGNPGSAR